jgi:hypothetical protein
MPSVDSLVPTPKAHVDPSVMQECEPVVDVPHRYVPREEGNGLWAEDRRRLGDCGRGKHAAIKTIRALIK